MKVFYKNFLLLNGTVRVAASKRFLRLNIQGSPFLTLTPELECAGVHVVTCHCVCVPDGTGHGKRGAEGAVWGKGIKMAVIVPLPSRSSSSSLQAALI